MKTIIAAILVLLSFNVAAAPAGGSRVHDRYDSNEKRGVVLVEDAIEADSLRISLGRDLRGFVEGKVCDDCETIKVVITPKTKAYENNVEVPLKRAAGRVGQSATVYYYIDSKEVSRISW
ncbi:MAG TPA: hypothetical protein ENJ11_05110 [Gammaproteobacteria bacterium]|nr:hypothetical protein [Gammaproteobacteria bacterium]